MIPGAIDCDIHPAVPSVRVLLPYMSDYWRNAFIERGQDSFNLAAYPPMSPLTARADWRTGREMPGSNFAVLQRQALDGFGSRLAICNVMYGGAVAVSETMGAAMCSAVNDWLRAEWLDRDPRLRASIVVPAQSPDLAATEIDRVASDRRFVQVLMPVAGELLYGRKYYWPIYEAAARHGLPVGLHTGSMLRHAATGTGWPSHALQDYVGATQAFESQLLSLVTHGVFHAFPDLKVVLIESGVTWLPGFLWRARKTWRGVRPEVPWLNRSPIEIIREHVRLTVQPIDAPDDPAIVEQVIDQIGSDDMLLFASDYPHHQFEGDQVLPAGFPKRLIDKITTENPLATYPRLAMAPQEVLQ